ncbi:GNAT family N-acetyltransferase [Nocardioides sp.]|uniref:GNAT family N-acetyltransferase n=1 Tax=Nocardioides sp. TaxID=35761 RepID=UPI0025D7335D|nr:GNAT family N-acetyltransferase [Nocardioides sp.]
MSPTLAEVTAASAAWVWLPDFAVTVETDEYLVVRYPDWFEEPLMLTRLLPRRRPAVVLDEALERARELGPSEILCWVPPDAAAGVEAMLAERGTPAQTVDVLARDLSAGGPDAPLSADLELRWVADVGTLRDYEGVAAEVFGGSLPPDDHLEHEAARATLALATGAAGRAVAYVDAMPVGAGGLTLTDGVARLWGGAVRESHRRRGIYRALLDARLAWGVEHGARFALVKGRVETSAPILRRAGFATYGQERSYRLPLAHRRS